MGWGERDGKIREWERGTVRYVGGMGERDVWISGWKDFKILD